MDKCVNTTWQIHLYINLIYLLKRTTFCQLIFDKMWQITAVLMLSVLFNGIFFLLYSNIIFPTESNQKLACNKFQYCTSAINLQNSWRHQRQNLSLNQCFTFKYYIANNKRVIARILGNIVPRRTYIALASSYNIKFYSGQYYPIFMQ